MRRYLYAAIVLTLLYPISSHAQVTPVIAPNNGILNAASLAADTTNTAGLGGLITIFGTNLATASGAATTSPLPFNINGTVLQIGSAFAPLLFVSPTQINAQIPFEAPTGAVPVVVFVNGRASAPVQVTVRTTAPGIFTVSQNGTGTVQALHADSTPVDGSSAAVPGEEIQIFATGLGPTISSGSTAPLATGLPGNGQPVLNAPTVSIGGSIATVTFAGAAQGVVGQYVVKAIVPSVASTGDQPLSLTIAGNRTLAPVTVPLVVPPPPPPTGSTGGIGGTSTGSATGPAIFSRGILNAASLDPASSDVAAPGSLISIFGINLATTTTGSGPAPLPRQLSGTSVLIGGLSAPLLLVSPSQINAQVPYEIQPGSTVDVVVNVNGVTSAPEGLRVATAAPGLFTNLANGIGAANAFHKDGSAITNNTPALPGEQITLLATGLGATLANANVPAVRTGESGNGQLTITTPTVTVGRSAAVVTSSIAAPGQVGTYIISIQLPDVPSGDEPITVAAAGNTSRAAVIRIGSLFPQPPAFLQANLAGSFTATFALTVANPSDPTMTEVATFSKPVPAPGCTITIAGTTGPTYTGLVHCQDFSDPNNLIAIIVGLKNGQFADNKLVFTSILDTGINHFFYVGSGTAPSGRIPLVADAPITAAAVSVDLKRRDFGAGDQVVGTINVALKVEATSTVPAQTVGLGGGFTDTIVFVQR